MKRTFRFLLALLPLLSFSFFSISAYSQVIVPIVGPGGGNLGGVGAGGGVGPIGPVIGPIVPGFPRVEFYQASPQIIEKQQPVRLSWRVQNAVRVDIYDGFRDTTISDLGTENFIEVWPNRSANYVLYAYGAEGQVSTATMTVYFSPLQIEYFTASTYIASPGQAIRLNWSSRSAARVDIFDSTLNTNYANLNMPSGSIEVYPFQTTTYTITVYNQLGESRILQLTVVVR